MTDRLFNTPFEMSLHVLMLLEVTGGGFTIDRITDYDFIAVYAQDFGFNVKSLNGENGFAFSELAARRSIMKTALRDLVLDGLVIPDDDSKRGITYADSAQGSSISRGFDSEYAQAYKKLIRQVHRRYKNRTDVELSNIINKRSEKEVRR